MRTIESKQIEMKAGVKLYPVQILNMQKVVKASVCAPNGVTGRASLRFAHETYAFYNRAFGGESGRGALANNFIPVNGGGSSIEGFVLVDNPQAGYYITISIIRQ